MICDHIFSFQCPRSEGGVVRNSEDHDISTFPTQVPRGGHSNNHTVVEGDNSSQVTNKKAKPEQKKKQEIRLCNGEIFYITNVRNLSLTYLLVNDIII